MAWAWSFMKVYVTGYTYLPYRITVVACNGGDRVRYQQCTYLLVDSMHGRSLPPGRCSCCRYRRGAHLSARGPWLRFRRHWRHRGKGLVERVGSGISGWKWLEGGGPLVAVGVGVGGPSVWTRGGGQEASSCHSDIGQRLLMFFARTSAATAAAATVGTCRCDMG